MTKRTSFTAHCFITLLFAVLTAVSLSLPAQAQVPPARALFLDLDTVFSQSNVGKSIRDQLQQMLSDVSEREKAAADGFAERERVLRELARDQETASLLSDWENLQAEKEGSGKLFQLERTAVQSVAADARRKVNASLNGIMQEILVERGANMVLSVAAVHVGGIDYNITAEVIARLNKQMPTLRVERPN